MKDHGLLTTAFLAMICMMAVPAARADDNDDGIHINIGLAYTTGPVRIYNDWKNDYINSGYTQVSTGVVVPVGLTISPYYQFDFGLGIGASVGPIVGDAFSTSNNGGFLSTSTSDYVIIPVGLDVRYSLMPISSSGVLPYVRVGIRYPITFGNLLSDSQPGIFAAVGVNFTSAHIGLEAAYDSSTVRVNAQGFSAIERPNEFTFTVSVYF